METKKIVLVAKQLSRKTKYNPKSQRNLQLSKRRTDRSARYPGRR